MPETYYMESTSNQSSNIADVVLSETGTTRLVMRSHVVENKKCPEAGVKITIAHQRKTPGDSWEDIPTSPLSSLKAGEEAKLNLDSVQTLELCRHLNNLFAINQTGGVRPGESRLVVGREDEVVLADSEHLARIVRNLLSQGYSEEVWKVLADTDPDLTTRLSNSQIQTNRQSVLIEFQRKLEQELTEPAWQEFFEKNRWIFGYGLNYQFLGPVESQAYVGGQGIDQKGSQIPDYMFHTEGLLKFSVLIEIKKPQTPLVVQSGRHRSGVWHLDRELVGGVSQLQVNCRTWEREGARSETNQGLVESGTFTVQPKGVLVIGKLDTLDNPSKRNTFEIFRRNLFNPEIITFDELYDRARFIVAQP